VQQQSAIGIAVSSGDCVNDSSLSHSRANATIHKAKDLVARPSLGARPKTWLQGKEYCP